MDSINEKPLLVTGATGYVGGRLAPRLLDAGYRVRAMARSVEKLRCRPWADHPLLEMVRGDVLDLPSLIEAATGCSMAYYLVHSMSSAGRRYASADRTAAANMVTAAETVGLSRIIYLGGLGDEREGLSRHLTSRNEVGRILSSGHTPTTVLRAAMILGSGSASFEILRYLVDRLPVMITPRWVRTRVQPIAISNVLGYLAGCLRCPETAGRVLDIGGPDVIDYETLFGIYAEEAGLTKRLIIPVPFFTPHLSSYWIHMVTPVPTSLARPLAEGLKNNVVAQDEPIRRLIPQTLLTCRETIRLALDRIRQQTVETCWMDAGRRLPAEWPGCEDPDYAGGTTYVATFHVRFKAGPEDVWAAITRMGLPDAPYFRKGLWRLRGALDRLIGGVGSARSRRPDRMLQVGDALDFWRVIDMNPERNIILLAEMKMPGQALLSFTLEPEAGGETRLSMSSRFLPRGLIGIVYYHVLHRLHEYVMADTFKSISTGVGRPLRFEPRQSPSVRGSECRISPVTERTNGNP
jgi:uncharacterized protein YbjT (DUF2867 family)